MGSPTSPLCSHCKYLAGRITDWKKKALNPKAKERKPKAEPKKLRDDSTFLDMDGSQIQETLKKPKGNPAVPNTDLNPYVDKDAVPKKTYDTGEPVPNEDLNKYVEK